MKKNIFVLLLSVLVLFGCSSEETTNTTNVDTIVYESVKGPVEVPADPQRIVTDYSGYLGNLIALGVPVVGADLTYTSPAWTDEMLEGITDVGQSTEAIAALEPDLIITFSEDAYASLSTIAPTVYIPYGMYNEEEIVIELGKITNHVEEANELIAKFNEEVAYLQTLIDQPELTYSIMEFYMDDPYIYGNKYGRLGYVIYDKLGLSGTLKAEETILASDESFVMLTLENLQDYVGDVLILSTPGAEVIENEILSSDVFKSTSAYTSGNIYYVDSELWYHTDMISLMAQMQDLEVILSGEL